MFLFCALSELIKKVSQGLYLYCAINSPNPPGKRHITSRSTADSEMRDRYVHLDYRLYHFG